ncbi:MAG: SGNH/GDSL hydrolase family protein [Pseudomonadota bacterium]
MKRSQAQRRALIVAWICLALLLFNLWALSRPWMFEAEPLFTWRKGPLVKESCPYSSFHAARYLWPAVALMLDGYIAALLGWLRVQRRLSRSLAGKLGPVVIAATLLVLFGGAELGVRAAIRHYQFNQYRPDPELYWFNRPNLRDQSDDTDRVPHSTNAWGFRGAEEIGPREPGELRVLIVGDSSTFGLGVPDPAVYGQVMRRRLEAATGRKVTIIDTGSPGHTSYQGWLLWERFAPLFAPDFLVWAFNNDSCLDMIAEQDRLDRPAAVIALQRVLYHSDLYLMAEQVALDFLRRSDRARFQQTYPSDKSGWVKRVSFRDYQDYLARFDRSARDRCAWPIFVRMPLNRRSVRDHEIYSTSFDDAYRDYLSEDFCVAEGRLCLDAERRFNGLTEPGLFLPDHLFHPSIRGHELLGEWLAQLVLERGLTEPPSPACAEER